MWTREKLKALLKLLDDRFGVDSLEPNRVFSIRRWRTEMYATQGHRVFVEWSGGDIAAVYYGMGYPSAASALRSHGYLTSRADGGKGFRFAFGEADGRGEFFLIDISRNGGGTGKTRRVRRKKAP